MNDIFEIWSQLGDPRINAYDVAGATLVDAEAQKVYLPVLDSEGVCLCSGNLVDYAVAPGQSVLLHASFGGVSDDVEAIDVRIPGFPNIDGVPVP